MHSFQMLNSQIQIHNEEAPWFKSRNYSSHSGAVEAMVMI